MDEFIYWWNHLPEDINPVLLQFGTIQIRYYGLMYVLSFLVFYLLISWRLRKEKMPFSEDAFEGYLTYAILGALVGGRIGYVLFYNLSHFLVNPVEIFWPVHSINGQTYFGLSGLSFHGGLLGVVATTIIFCKRRKIALWTFADSIIVAVPLGYMFGRIGNFLNNELYGRVTTSSIGMYFKGAPTYELRHPSQLYEALFEGLLLFVILWGIRHKKVFDGYLFSLFVVLYGIVRFFIEFYREPDAHLGFVFVALSMGQVLCLAMVIAGLILMCFLRKHKSYG